MGARSKPPGGGRRRRENGCHTSIVASRVPNRRSHAPRIRPTPSTVVISHHTTFQDCVFVVSRICKFASIRPPFSIANAVSRFCAHPLGAIGANASEVKSIARDRGSPFTFSAAPSETSRWARLARVPALSVCETATNRIRFVRRCPRRFAPFPGAAGLRRAAIPPAVIDEQKTKSYGVLRVSFPLTDRSPPYLTLHRPSLRSPLLPHPEGHLQRVRLPLRSQA